MSGWDDEPLPEDAAIAAAHPMTTGRYDLHQEAMRLVGAKRSKGALVDLVNWLLAEREEACRLCVEGQCTCTRPNVREPCEMHDRPHSAPLPDERRDVVRLARTNGCSPKWQDGIFGWAWHCGCPDLRHAVNQQCSMITWESARRPRIDAR